MSGILLSSSASETSSFSSDSTSDSPASTGSSTASISGRLSPLPEADEGKAGLEGGGPLPIKALAEADRAVLDLGGPSFFPLRAGADRSEGTLDHSVDLDDIMLKFGTKEVGAEEATGSHDWMLTEVIVKERGEGLKADACRVDEKETSSIEVVAGGSQAMVRNHGAREREEREAVKRLTSVRERNSPSRGQSGRGEKSVGGGEAVQAVGTSEGSSDHGEAEGCMVVAEEGGEAEDVVVLDEGTHPTEGCQAIVRYFEVGEKMGSVANKRHAGKLVAETSPLVAERFCPYTSATDLVESVGLGSSSDTEEDELYMGRLGVEEPLAIVADEHQSVEVEGSSGRLGKCESEGLT